MPLAPTRWRRRLLERLGVQLNAGMGSVDARTAAGCFLGMTRMRRTVGPEEKARTARNRRIDQRLADSETPQVRLDEQPVELRADDRGKSRQFAIELGDYDLAVGDLRRRQVDGVGVREQLLAILRQFERGPPLQLFERFKLLRPRQPQAEPFNEL